MKEIERTYIKKAKRVLHTYAGTSLLVSVAAGLGAAHFAGESSDSQTVANQFAQQHEQIKAGNKQERADDQDAVAILLGLVCVSGAVGALGMEGTILLTNATEQYRNIPNTTEVI